MTLDQINQINEKLCELFNKKFTAISGYNSGLTLNKLSNDIIIGMDFDIDNNEDFCDFIKVSIIHNCWFCKFYIIITGYIEIAFRFLSQDHFSTMSDNQIYLNILNNLEYDKQKISEILEGKRRFSYIF